MESQLMESVRLTSSKIGKGDVDRIETDLASVEGVRQVNVDPDQHTVTVIYDPDVTSATLMQGELSSRGYPVDDVSETSQISSTEGLTPGSIDTGP